jgi:hypothetical protein
MDPVCPDFFLSRNAREHRCSLALPRLDGFSDRCTSFLRKEDKKPCAKHRKL